MPDFNPPFANAGERRLATTTEQDLGWPCGPIPVTLLNGLFHLLTGNVNDVIQTAGVTGADGDLTKLRRAIEALIAASTGGGTADDYILLAQARNRLPIFPEVQTSDGRLTVTSPSAGTVRLAGGQTFLHRGIFPVTTTQTDFVTDPSKTYHLRWNPLDGFVLRDLASGSYNPGTLSESSVAFDSDYDDMLIARVVTNSSNVATITTLANKASLIDEQEVVFSGVSNVGQDSGRFSGSLSFNWSRTPVVQSSVVYRNNNGLMPDNDVFRRERTLNRYSITELWTADFTHQFHVSFMAVAK